MNKIETIAVIGAGRMGGAIASNLAKGYQVRVFDPSPAAVQRCVDAGAHGAASALEAVAGADVVITSLPLPTHVLASYAEIIDQLSEDAICLDVSTIDPATARQVADQLEASGRRFVACPLGKGPAQADAGESPLFIGGDADAIDALDEVFAVIGAERYLMGNVEGATMFKIVSNMIGMTNLAVLAEGYLLCKKAGVADDAFAAALADTGGWSAQAQMRLPLMMAGDFAPRFAARLGLKDVRLAVDIAAQWGIPTPVGAVGMTQLANAVAHGYGDLDVDAIYKVLDLDDSRHHEG